MWNNFDNYKIVPIFAVFKLIAVHYCWLMSAIFVFIHILVYLFEY
nr:MAG TPA: hypothetical protein [Caudoviricetes sp.]